MSNIERQQTTVAKLAAVMRQRYTGATNMQLNRIRCAHANAMVKAGYTVGQAAESAQECSDVARLEADAK